MSLCRYKDILGYPREGIHSYRLGGFAIVDVIMTILGGLMLAYYFNVSYSKTVIALFILGIIAHRLFCVRTTVDKILF